MAALSVFSGHMNVQATLKRFIGRDDYGSIAYSADEGILCTISSSNKQIIKKDGNTVTSNTKILTETKLTLGDIVTVDTVEYVIEGLSYARDKAGSILYYKGECV